MMYIDSRQGPFLIKHGWDMPSATFVVNNSSRMDSMPFDGVVLKMDNDLSSSVQSQSPVSYRQFESSLSGISDIKFSNLKHNFLMVYSTPAGDVFDDWSTPLSNYSNMSRAARGAGLEGIFFDNEEYFGDALTFPENCSAGKNVGQCQDQAYLRGRQVMESIISTWPEVKIIVTLGPFISEESTADYFNSHGIAWNNIAWANQLRGSFVIGMASATEGKSAQIIDGGEVYSARTNEDFENIKYWQKYGMPAQSDLIPENLQPSWPELVSSSFGVYDSTDLISGSPMNADIWTTTLTNALNSADQYVWAYTEQYDWWNTGWPATAVPHDWVLATREALDFLD